MQTENREFAVHADGGLAQQFDAAAVATTLRAMVDFSLLNDLEKARALQDGAPASGRKFSECAEEPLSKRLFLCRRRLQCLR